MILKFILSGNYLDIIDKDQWWVKIIKLVQKNIRIYSDAEEFTKQISKYIQMPKILPNKYPNIFGCPRFDWTNIRLYSVTQDLTERISKHIWMGEKPLIFRFHLKNIYLNTQIFLLITDKAILCNSYLNIWHLY